MVRPSKAESIDKIAHLVVFSLNPLFYATTKSVSIPLALKTGCWAARGVSSAGLDGRRICSLCHPKATGADEDRAGLRYQHSFFHLFLQRRAWHAVPWGDQNEAGIAAQA
jgi:hypothetical protein